MILDLIKSQDYISRFFRKRNIRNWDKKYGDRISNEIVFIGNNKRNWIKKKWFISTPKIF